MKRYIPCVLMCALAVLSVANAVVADEGSSAVQMVTVRVNPNISINASGFSTNQTTIQTGDFDATISFAVNANVQEVDLSVTATALYKDGEPASLYQIPVKTSDDVDVTLETGNALDMINVLAWEGEMTTNFVEGSNSNEVVCTGTGTLNGMEAVSTEYKTFGSGVNEHFSQQVDVDVTWDQVNNELPQGMYIGYVELVGLTDPVIDTVTAS